MAVSARKSSIISKPVAGLASLRLATLLAGAAVMALPSLAQAQERERMDHDMAESGGRDREAGPRPQRAWGGENRGGDGGMQRDRPAQAPVQQESRRPAQSWSQPAPQAAPAPVVQAAPPAMPSRDRAYSDNGRGGAPRQQGWDGQRWNGQNWDGQNRQQADRGWQNRSPDNAVPRGDDRPRQWNGDPRQSGQWGNRDNDRRWDGQRRGDDDRRWNGDRGWNNTPSWDRNRAPGWSNRRESWSSRSDRDWNREWRQDRRYDWRGWRNNHREVYRLGRYLPPYRSYSYRRLGIGFYLESGFFGTSYWLNDPWAYRLPPAYGPYRWVRYYDDAVMVNIYTGQVVDVLYDFFW